MRFCSRYRRARFVFRAPIQSAPALHSSDDRMLDQQVEDDPVHGIRDPQPTIAQEPLSGSSDTGN
jgi:hypothetical protein